VAISVDYIADWSGRLTGRLYTQFRNKVTWTKWVALIAKQAQDMEDAAQTLFSLLDITNAVGLGLDLIGRIVGQPRLGFADPTYRLLLYARIAANKSDGSPEDLYVVLEALLGATIGLIYEGSIGAKEFAMRVKSPITRIQAIIGAGLLRDATEAGSKAILEWQENPTSVSFVYDGTAAQGYDAGLYAGAKQV
jgi:hypothetical protein